MRELIDEMQMDAEFAELVAEQRKVLADETWSGKPKTLQALRMGKGWSQAEVARRIESTQARLSLLENGKTEDPNYTTLKKLAEALEVGIDTVAAALEASMEASR